SLLLERLQLEVPVATGIVIGISGFHPHTGWKPGAVAPPAAKPGCVVARDFRLDPGISVPLGDVVWESAFDEKTGWLWIHERGQIVPDDAESIEVATGFIISLRDGSIAGVYLRPTMHLTR